MLVHLSTAIVSQGTFIEQMISNPASPGMYSVDDGIRRVQDVVFQIPSSRLRDANTISGELQVGSSTQYDGIVLFCPVLSSVHS